MSGALQRLSISQKLVILATLFIVAIVGILLYTVVTIEDQKSDAVVINIAGRQRMLNQMFMKEILSASQGYDADYQYTAGVWKGSLEALIHGGRAMLLGTKDTVALPPTHDETILQKLYEQQRLIEEFIQKGEVFAGLPKGDPTRAAKLMELRALNDRLNTVTLAAARLFYAGSEAKVAGMLKVEGFLGVCVALLGILLTVQVVRGSSALVEEVAHRKRAEEELRQSEAKRIEAFRQSDELKSALLSLVSHELRTPLTSIKTSVVSLLRFVDGLSEDTRVELLQGIDEEVDYLDRLVNNLLDMSRIEAGQLVPNCDWYPIEDLVEGATRRAATALQGRPLDVEVSDGLMPIYADAVEIQQVLVNLLDNAAKYSPNGTLIQVKATQTQAEVILSVSNEGEGIPVDEIGRVFDRFHRVRSNRSRPVRGSGLGLAICKGIVAAHGGRIWVESTPGERTTVMFSLPRREPEPTLFELPSRES